MTTQESYVPTYEYACTDCGARLEIVQSFTDGTLTECPTCGGRLRKIFSPVGVVFKGSGFYKTDSRAAGKKKDSSASPDSTSDAPVKAGSTTGSSDTASGSSGSAAGGSSSGSGASSAGSGDSSSPAKSGGSAGSSNPSTPAAPKPTAAAS